MDLTSIRPGRRVGPLDRRSRWLATRRAFASGRRLVDRRGQAGALLAHLGEGRPRRPATAVRLRASLRSEHPEYKEGDRSEDDHRDNEHDSGMHDPSLPPAAGRKRHRSRLVPEVS